MNQLLLWSSDENLINSSECVAVFICVVHFPQPAPHFQYQFRNLFLVFDSKPNVFMEKKGVLNFDVRVLGINNFLIKKLPGFWNPIITKTCICLLTVSVLAS
jgi:hypothetical protein